jgi:demethylmenaquinone methyltransferase/2-methoxy-6-polyprenyl-1,4-benzoquinol methylase
MPNLFEPSGKREYITAIFSRIVKTYDLMNKIITFGQDSSWKKLAVSMLEPERNGIYLDIGTGTGDIAQLIAGQNPECSVVAVDLTYPMVQLGKDRNSFANIYWLLADAQDLPFSQNVFDGVISGYLIRNAVDPLIVLSEKNRVLNPGKKAVSLDTTPPEKNLLYPLVSIYLKFLIPFLGRMIAQDKSAYSYLQESTRRYIDAKQLLCLYKQAGFINPQFKKFMAGTIAIHHGLKTKNQEN